MSENDHSNLSESVRHFVESYMPPEYWTHDVKVTEEADVINVDITSVSKLEVDRIVVNITV